MTAHVMKVSLVVAAAVIAVGCSQRAEMPAPEATAGEPPAAVEITSPEAGATVASPFEVCMAATGVSIEPSGDVVEGVGHFHVLVDPSADERGQLLLGEPVAIPNDETHLHLGDASSCVMVEAGPGEHTLMAVVADGAHINMNPPLIAETVVTVGE